MGIPHMLRAINEPLGSGNERAARAIFQDWLAVAREELRFLLAQDEAVETWAGQSQRHSNGFDKVVIASGDGCKLVGHFWNEEARDPEIHNHRWNFVSRILRGSVRAQTFDQADMNEGQTLQRFEYRSPGGASTYELIPQGGVAIVPAELLTRTSGTVYFQHANDLHLAESGSPDTVTLIVQGPVLRQTTTVIGQIAPTTHRRPAYPLKPSEVLSHIDDLIGLL